MRKLSAAVAVWGAVLAVGCGPETEVEPAAETGGVESALRTVGPYRIINYRSDKCLEIPGNSAANGVQLDQWDCYATRKMNEDWYLDYVSNTQFRIRNRQTGKCLNVKGASRASNTPIIQWDCGNYPNELFLLSRAIGNSPAGVYNIVSAMNLNTMDGQVLTVHGNSTARGAKVETFVVVTEALNQWFTLGAAK